MFTVVGGIWWKSCRSSLITSSTVGLLVFSNDFKQLLTIPYIYIYKVQNLKYK